MFMMTGTFLHTSPLNNNNDNDVLQVACACGRG